ncbi:acetyltransferase [Companilactobacillus crustorum]|uniref:Acetyltransferase n=3 Tax=Companilactobacillus TaxID=2767879 RepID=A0A837RJU0_9LACO|nr:GNAT family N-acetyltransferase [Companilactobacillus crustorum]HCD08393.1 GNAT family N-acetyltransferase [Lactobacillus sp.]APU70980.1 hypothetical protein BI355_0657 [Companilactobacillus crustorum]KRK44339.1 acetyltransferase [Companilactobacillus crustorum JCM 15951]KRO21642.1 acetyltransferase [Companilactobacillus crustorum]WDT66157.1 GNAT family N-acetyltransferase [Companilactobacillus crustorum]
MIRKMHKDEIEVVSNIWLNGNLTAHNFIDKNYWLKALATVKEQFQQADVYVFIDNNVIKGFVGVTDNYIAGIFVEETFRNQGIGQQLLNFLKQNYLKLSLDVYDKNIMAQKLYLKNGFKIVSQDIEQDNNEKEYHMLWNQGEDK